MNACLTHKGNATWPDLMPSSTINEVTKSLYGWVEHCKQLNSSPTNALDVWGSASCTGTLFYSCRNLDVPLFLAPSFGGSCRHSLPGALLPWQRRWCSPKSEIHIFAWLCQTPMDISKFRSKMRVLFMCSPFVSVQYPWTSLQIPQISMILSDA